MCNSNIDILLDKNLFIYLYLFYILLKFRDTPEWYLYVQQRKKCFGLKIPQYIATSAVAQDLRAPAEIGLSPLSTYFITYVGTFAYLSSFAVWLRRCNLHF